MMKKTSKKPSKRASRGKFVTRGQKITTTGYRIPSKVNEIAHLKMGPLLVLGDGSILAIENNCACISHDDARTWEQHKISIKGVRLKIAPGALLMTQKGTIILSFVNLLEMTKFKWNTALNDMPGARCPTYVVRSLDGGRSWQDVQKLHDEWSGANRDMIETACGSVVFTSMMLGHNPGHHTVLTYTSRDEGLTWLRSNIIDLGGIGNHSGVSESTLVQREDRRLWMLMRTNWGSFWETFSDDEGLSWKGHRPTSILSGSTPGMLCRLASGRLVLVWNYPCIDGDKPYPAKGDDRLEQWAEVPVVDQREELSIAFSDDDGRTWGGRSVIAKTTRKGTQLCYPNVLEREPGLLWINTGFAGKLAIELREEDYAIQA